MANIAFSSLYDQVMPYLPGVELGMLNLQIRKVLRDFMTRTTITREEFLFDTVAGTATYKLTPTYGEVSSILGVYAQGSEFPLPVVPEERRWARSPGQPAGWFALLASMPAVWPVPDDVYPVRIVAAVRPALATDNVPEEIVAEHAETIAAGVLSAMYAMPGKPWTKTDAAAASGRAYSNSVKTIRSTLRDGGQPNVSTFVGVRRFGK